MMNSNHPQLRNSLIATLIGVALLAALVSIPALGRRLPATNVPPQSPANPATATQSIPTQLAVAISLTRTPPPRTPTQVATLALPTPTPTPQTSPSRVAVPTSPSPTPTASPTPTPTLTITPMPTITLTPTPSLTLTPIPTKAEESRKPKDHYWLQRPISPEGHDIVSRFYPYGSTAGGRFQVHHGVEFENSAGTPVLAVAAGEVVVAGDDAKRAYGPYTDFYGQLVVVELDRRLHDQPVFTLYAHLSEVGVQVGQRVAPGDVLGTVGMTGVALGPHLHFEVRVGANTYDHTRNPELWLKPLPGHGTIAGQVVDAQGEPIPQALILLHKAEASDRPWREVESYGPGVNPDDGWGENFLFGDVPAGSYVIKTVIEGLVYTREVEVKAGKTTFVSIKAVD